MLAGFKASPELRLYQQRDVDAIRALSARGVRRICYQLPTGAGKTVVFVHIVMAALAKERRAIILTHRIEILEQVAATLSRSGVPFGIIAAGYPATADAPVQIASVFTLARRQHRLDDVDLIVVDECHHATASTWRRVLAAAPRACVLGVTATPVRLDGRGLDDLFDALVTGPSMRELIASGYLSPLTAYGPRFTPKLKRVGVRQGDYAPEELARVMSRDVVIGSAVTEYTRLCPGAPAIAFAVTVAHSRAVATAFRNAGWRAAHVDGETPKDERRTLIAALAGGELDVLSNCGLISEGLDVPGVTAAILLRPTLSLALYLQMVGRALRPGKPRAYILDHAGNTLLHGLPDAERKWTLAGRQQKAVGAWRCGKCGAFNSAGDTSCRTCGAVSVIPELNNEAAAPELNERAGALEAVAPLPAGTNSASLEVLAAVGYEAAIRWAGRDVGRLRRVAEARGYKPGWIWHRLLFMSGGPKDAV